MLALEDTPKPSPRTLGRRTNHTVNTPAHVGSTKIPCPQLTLVGQQINPRKNKTRTKTWSRLGPAAGGQAKVIVVAKEGDPTLVELERLPKDGSASVLFRGATAEDFSTPEGKQALAEANVLLNCSGERASA